MAIAKQSPSYEMLHMLGIFTEKLVQVALQKISCQPYKSFMFCIVESLSWSTKLKVQPYVVAQELDFHPATVDSVKWEAETH